MPYVSFDLDLDDIETEDLVKDVCRRLMNDRVTEKHRKYLAEALNIPIDDVIEIKTLEDRMKYEHLVKVFNKYRSSDIERLLPE